MPYLAMPSLILGTSSHPVDILSNWKRECDMAALDVKVIYIHLPAAYVEWGCYNTGLCHICRGGEEESCSLQGWVIFIPWWWNPCEPSETTLISSQHPSGSGEFIPWWWISCEEAANTDRLVHMLTNLVIVVCFLYHCTCILYCIVLSC